MEVPVRSYIHKTFESACNIFAAIWYFSVTKRGIQEYATGMSSANNTLNCLVWYSVFPHQTWQMYSLATCTNTGLFKMIVGVLTTCHTHTKNTNVMHLILFIRQIFSSTCLEYQVLIFRRIQLYVSSIWHRHSL